MKESLSLWSRIKKWFRDLWKEEEESDDDWLDKQW
jgi:hypothetical protein